MAKAVARISGTAIKPGVSKNGRLYSPAAIERAVDRARQRIAEGAAPLTMLTHHDAEDDSTRVVGQLTDVWLGPDGSAKYSAEIADTEHGRAIASLVDTSGGSKPFLRGVSIRGAWAGPVRTDTHEGQRVQTADDLELDGLDFTRKPGVSGAGVEDFAWAASPKESATGRVLIYESAPEAEVTVVEEADVESSTKVTDEAAAREKVREALKAAGLLPHVYVDGVCQTCGY